MRWTINIVAISLGSSEPEQASMPIRQRGRLARRRSSYSRVLFNFRTIAPALIEAHQMEAQVACAEHHHSVFGWISRIRRMRMAIAMRLGVPPLRI
jgi:hypothetical protein